jgi:hypothetical protein
LCVSWVGRPCQPSGAVPLGLTVLRSQQLVGLAHMLELLDLGVAQHRAPRRARVVRVTPPRGHPLPHGGLAFHGVLGVA